ncbi:unnamed protein product [Urochloa humidicola]
MDPFSKKPKSDENGAATTSAAGRAAVHLDCSSARLGASARRLPRRR